MPSHDGAAWLLPGSAAAARGLLVLLAACGARSGGVPAADGGPGDLDATLTATDAGAGAVGPDAGLEAAARAAADIAAEATATVGPGVDGTGAPDIGADTSDAADGADAAKGAGVAKPVDYAVFQNHGYMGLYGGLNMEDIHRRKKLKKSQKILDHMGSTELAANLFRATQAEEKLRRDKVQGKDAANRTHHGVGALVRQTIRELVPGVRMVVGSSGEEFGHGE